MPKFKTSTVHVDRSKGIRINEQARRRDSIVFQCDAPEAHAFVRPRIDKATGEEAGVSFSYVCPVCGADASPVDYSKSCASHMTVLNYSVQCAAIRKIPANLMDYYQDQKGGKCYG